MKTTMKLLGIAFMTLSLTLTSCGKDGDDGDNGAMGLQGEQGIAGTNGMDGEDGAGEDGTNGTNGTNGEDGNANVRAITFNLSAASGTSHTIATSELTAELVEDGVVLAYLKAATWWYSIPNQEILTNGFSSIDVSSSFVPSGVNYSYRMIFRRDGSSATISTGDLDELRLVLIPASTSTSGKSSNNNILDALHDKGVDPTNYYQVMEHFNLKK